MAELSQQECDFSIVNAFSSSVFGGNPAVVLFLDAPLSNDDLYLKIAQNFNQPMACFVFPAETGETEPDETTVTFRIRWFTVSRESPTMRTWNTCGRPCTPCATWSRSDTLTGAADRIEIEMPLFDAKSVEDSEFALIKGVISKAFRRDVKVKYIGCSGSGEPGSDHYVLVELDESEALGDVDIDIPAFNEETPYRINILTRKSQQPSIAYEARMFAPRSGVPEDQVCGSANCLMAPYWANKMNIASKAEMVAKFVSPRGGVLWVTVDQENRKVYLAGEAKLTIVGQVFL
ncbi:Diaminopimelate epimerase-like protein [Fomitiporia mediterranea MF3/22]|uniref:Diaminopimelate epimerase-like protein n=1 Tax=Fomitiporia mediterranea (strain MF3/22) TaxID=694068 RepID=UPI0004409189|nr:Diaminopimelate epimerase-like protein [Fomitiporia mediterranea MF3/22]EJC98597.1 Diaminopimelate epimerase-like protein [Fomitiporia mediterranea MF3/22]